MYATQLFRPHRSLDQELSRFFDSQFGKSDTFTPACEILDEDKHYVLTLDVAGINREDIDVEIKDNQLVITGERKAPEKEALRSERSYGKFTRVFKLPSNLVTDNIEARQENGVLELRLPKKEEVQPRKIQIL